MEYLSREQVRTVDRLAIESLGIPGIILMENAGRGAAEEILRFAQSCGHKTPELNVAVLCGGGNNGGDGYVIARHLHNAGVKAILYSATDTAQLTGDAAVHFTIAEKMHLERWDILDEAQLNEAMIDLEKSQIIVDALLGTGFMGEVRPHLAAVIRRCNALGLNERKVVAIDVPSGLDCDSGKPANPTVRADLTITFVAKKKGFAAESAKPYIGRVIITGIGAPPELIDKV